MSWTSSAFYSSVGLNRVERCVELCCPDCGYVETYIFSNIIVVECIMCNSEKFREIRDEH